MTRIREEDQLQYRQLFQELSEQKVVVQRWASLWTSRSAWPFGLICMKFILDQVRPHLVSYLVSYVVSVVML